ncbi:MAG: hypothetical protein IPM14_05250 [bacterium]|nr:hypothetical protein [bacterium]
MKEKENLISKRLDLLSGKSKIEYESDIVIIATNLRAFISFRIDNYMHQIPDYKFLPLKEWDEKKGSLYTETNKRFSAFVLRKLALNEFAPFMISEKEYIVKVWELFENNAEEFYKTLDEILCILEPKFVEVVEYKPDTKTKENREKMIEEETKKKNEKINNGELAKIYTELCIKIYPQEIKLKDLARIKGSKSTWSRSLRRREFLFGVVSYIEKKLTNSKIDSNTEVQLSEVKENIVSRIAKLEKKKKNKRGTEILSDNMDNEVDKPTYEQKETTNNFIDNIELD